MFMAAWMAAVLLPCPTADADASTFSPPPVEVTDTDAEACASSSPDVPPAAIFSLRLRRDPSHKNPTSVRSFNLVLLRRDDLP